VSAQSPVLSVSCPGARLASASALRVQGVQFRHAFNARLNISDAETGVSRTRFAA